MNVGTSTQHIHHTLKCAPFHVSKTKNSLKGCYFESLQDTDSNVTKCGQEHGAEENCIIMNFKTHTHSIRMIKSRRMRLAGHVAHRILVETPERKISLGIHEAKMRVSYLNGS